MHPAVRWIRAALLLTLASVACKQPAPTPLSTTTLQSPEEVARLLRCEPERPHTNRSFASPQQDGECDSKIDALRFLQATRTTGQIPDEQDGKALAFYFWPEGLIAEDVGSSIEFLDYEVVNALRGPTVLRARLSSGLVVAFCCGKVKACRADRACNCNSDCNDEQIE